MSYRFGAVIPFIALHLLCLLAFVIPFHWAGVVWLVATYSVRMFAITAGYHRYFSHRSYRLGRTAQFIMAVLAQSSAQKGVLWWAAHHRHHHRHSDSELDVHSPGRRGFWWSHVGWILSNDYDTYDPNLVRDFAVYPEIRWLSRHHWVPSLVLGIVMFVTLDFPTFFWGYVLSTVLLFHCTFTINSLAHVWGNRRFDTKDDSRNNFLLALITFGEGWHNNHHQYMSSCRQGLKWWEIDITYMILRLLSRVGIVSDLREAPTAATR